MPPPIQAPPHLPPNVPSFYMRELPKDKLVGYDTPEGKKLFKAALLEGGLEAFFPLSQQFLTVSASSAYATAQHRSNGQSTAR